MFTPSEAQLEALYARVQAESDADLHLLFAEQRAQAAQQLRSGPTGPRTAAGKQKSRLNAYKHGLTGKIHLFTDEEKAEFAAHCQGIIESLAPVGAHETDLAQTIAENRWRLKRARVIENNLYAIGQDTNQPPSQDPGERRLSDAQLQLHACFTQHKIIPNLPLYENRIQRVIDRSLAELRTLRAERQAALEEELLLAELAEAEGVTYQPLPNPAHPEFEFSASQVLQALARKKRLAKARERFQAVSRTPPKGENKRAAV